MNLAFEGRKILRGFNVFSPLPRWTKESMALRLSLLFRH